MEKHQEAEEMWRAELTGKSPRLRHLRLWLKLLPSEPRCKLCNAPFHGLGRPIAAILGRQRSRKNPRFCNYCETIARTYRGGAEVDLTLLFVDVRGSTTLAERVTPSEFSRLMNRFYDVATRVLIDSDAWIDKLVGDEVIAFYLPFLEDHAARGARRAGIDAGDGSGRSGRPLDSGWDRHPDGDGVRGRHRICGDSHRFYGAGRRGERRSPPGICGGSGGNPDERGDLRGGGPGRREPGATRADAEGKDRVRWRPRAES